MKVTEKKRFSLNFGDFAKGALIAVLAPVLAVLADVVGAGELSMDWGLIGQIALSSFVAYLAKNFVSGDVVIVEPESDHDKARVQQLK